MERTNVITIKLGRRPGEFSVENTKSSRGHTHKLTNQQKLLCFLLVTLLMPAPHSQRKEHAWLRQFLGPWSRHAHNDLLNALENVSPNTLDSYMHMISDARLVMPNGDTAFFGDYVQAHMDEIRKAFMCVPQYSDWPNADWISAALGTIIRSVEPPPIAPHHLSTINYDNAFEERINGIRGTQAPVVSCASRRNEAIQKPVPESLLSKAKRWFGSLITV